MITNNNISELLEAAANDKPQNPIDGQVVKNHVTYDKADILMAAKKRIEELEARQIKPAALLAFNELAIGVTSINFSPAYQVPESITGDDEPCYWQREEWITWILELAAIAKSEQCHD